ncbi:MAG: DinB family protein [Acidobacteria bacterium]|nr:DinB family protein [Acidobacteriota bacterium]
MKSAILFLAAVLPLCAADPQMSDTERAKVLQYLDESRTEFLAAIDGLTEAQWKWKPAPERWSVGEVAEHIVKAEAALFGNVTKALASAANPNWEAKTKGKTETIERVMAPRLGKAQAPEALVPGGGMTIADAKAIFEKQRAGMLEFVKTTSAPLKQHTVEHPFQFFNTLNGYQWLIYSPLHTMRHNKQIAEVKATAGYPK